MFLKSVSTSIKDVDSSGIVVVAANAFGNVDSDNDVSLHGSFQKTLKENFDRAKWFLNHKRDQLLGVPIEGIEMQDCLQLTGKINMHKEIGRDTLSDYKLYAEYNKSLEHSIGVDALKYRDDQGIRKVSEWKFWEYSTLTSWGSNERTPLIALKEDPTKAIEWMTLQLKKGDYTDDRFRSIEKSLDNLLKSLAEPDRSTLNDQPIALSELSDISTSFINSLNH